MRSTSERGFYIRGGLKKSTYDWQIFFPKNTFFFKKKFINTVNCSYTGLGCTGIRTYRTGDFNPSPSPVETQLTVFYFSWLADRPNIQALTVSNLGLIFAGLDTLTIPHLSEYWMFLDSLPTAFYSASVEVQSILSYSGIAEVQSILSYTGLGYTGIRTYPRISVSRRNSLQYVFVHTVVFGYTGFLVYRLQNLSPNPRVRYKSN